MPFKFVSLMLLLLHNDFGRSPDVQRSLCQLRKDQLSKCQQAHALIFDSRQIELLPIEADSVWFSVLS